ncbi:MAG: hypothetical protein PHT18_04995, partial [Proteiniphilum sp.]|nr:hypothetical protein [Proteiniphilum sp.]
MQDICQCTPFLRAKFTFHPSFSRTASICKTAKECPFSRTFIFLEKKSMFIFLDYIYENHVVKHIFEKMSEKRLHFFSEYVWTVRKLSLSLHPLLRGTPLGKAGKKRSLGIYIHIFIQDIKQSIQVSVL